MVTIKDVALRAGVSLITVSRVVNTPDKVAKETRGKVEAAMKELGYVRNVAAGNLVYKRSGIICVYASRNFSRLDPFLSHFLLGVSEALGENPSSVMVTSSLVTTRLRKPLGSACRLASLWRSLVSMMMQGSTVLIPTMCFLPGRRSATSLKMVIGG